MEWPGRPCMGYGMALRASHGIVWPGWHHMVSGMAWRAIHGIWLLPGRQSMGLGIVCSMAWRALHGIWYGLAGKEWCMVWSGVHGMTYGMAWWTSHGIWYGLFWGRCLDIYSYCVLNVNQAFVIGNICKYQV